METILGVVIILLISIILIITNGKRVKINSECATCSQNKPKIDINKLKEIRDRAKKDA